MFQKILFTLGLVLLPVATLAHPLIPDEVIEYMEENPDATDAEIDAFFEENFGSFDEFYGESGDDLSVSDLEEIPSGIRFDRVEGDPGRFRDNLQLLLSVREGDLSFGQNSWRFVVLGFEHILIGLDHILFVLALILVLVPWRRVLTMITTFTVAHSITLIAAGTGLVTLSGRIVEPIIALSIAYIALTSVFLQKIPLFANGHNKLGVIFLFGLFHGLGFAGVFSDLSIPPSQYFASLLFFNIGVEIGQVAILAVALPILWFLARQVPRLHFYFVRFFAVLISLLALLWFVQRAFGL